MKFNFLQGTEPSKFDLNRTKIRLEGFGHYASVAALLLNAALRLESSTPTKLDGRKQEDIVKIAFVGLITTSIVLGGYTATIFSLLCIYAKSFIGMGMDDEYTEFFQATEGIRKSAFLAFVGTILSFNMALVLSLYLSHDGRIRFWISSITAVVIAVLAQNGFLIMKYASAMYE